LPAAIGFIAVFGVAMLNGVVLVSYFIQLRDEGLDLATLVRQGCLLRLRPVLMTATVAILGLVPLLLARGVGAEVPARATKRGAPRGGDACVRSRRSSASTWSVA
jgi:cobalt-zinc-cadmium resistance protein CzcA